MKRGQKTVVDDKKALSPQAVSLEEEGQGVASRSVSDKRNIPKEGRVHPRNKLNHLTGREWIRFTRSWFIHNPARRTSSEVQHPAKYPESMVQGFIEFFTQKGQVVLDPFMGVGSTIKAAAGCGRIGVGIELNTKYYELAKLHLGKEAEAHFLLNDDANRVVDIFQELGLECAHFVMTSPPYWNMLGKSRGNVFSVHKERKAKGLDTVYSLDDPKDLGNLDDYEQFLSALQTVFRKVSQVLRPGGYLVVVVQNLRSPEGRMVTLAWDLTAYLSDFLIFKGEKIWCQDNKKLGIWGYPSEFVSNVHHHYCLIFKKA